MPRFAQMIYNGMLERGHNVEIWSPKPYFFKLPAPLIMKKWLGYVDQFLLFPAIIRKRLKSCSTDTLFVLTDQALGPWFHHVSNRPHVFHCHDFLAQRAALGEIPENLTSWTGRIYQSIIKSGYSRGNFFISVSHETKKDLHAFLPHDPQISEVVHNGLNPNLKPIDVWEARLNINKLIGVNTNSGYLLHVGGNQWNKNRIGVIEIYNAWRSFSKLELPLVLIGEYPTPSLRKSYLASPYNRNIHFIIGAKDNIVQSGYSGAIALIFPSLAEGFGWPIVEAMACGCPVITTGQAPMTEVAGKAGIYISRRPSEKSKTNDWAHDSALALNSVVNLSDSERARIIKAGFENCKKFNSQLVLDKIESIYFQVLSEKYVAWVN